MGTAITPCCGLPGWIERALFKASQFDDFDDALGVENFHDPQDIVEEADKAIADYTRDEKTRREIEKKEAERAAREAELSGQLVNPGEWGKGGKRPMGIGQAVKNKVQKSIYAIAKGWHSRIPIGEIFDALFEYGLIPIQEDGYRWEGMLIGGHECGSEGARNQFANLPTVARDANGKWALTTSYLHLTWCKMHGGKYEVVCYLS